jgi:hypothetical protein
MPYGRVVFFFVVFIELAVIVHPRFAKWTVQASADVSCIKHALSVPTQVRDQTTRPLDLLIVFTDDPASNDVAAFARSPALLSMQIDLLVVKVNHALDVLTKCDLTEVINPIVPIGLDTV